MNHSEEKVMASTLKTTYQGWHITVRCLKFRARANTGGNADSYTASGRAVRENDAADGDWTDARPQVATLGGRIFNTTGSCAQVLLAEMTVMLDALKKLPAPAQR
jgi:hypothetical protein